MGKNKPAPPTAPAPSPAAAGAGVKKGKGAAAAAAGGSPGAAAGALGAAGKGKKVEDGAASAEKTAGGKGKGKAAESAPAGAAPATAQPPQPQGYQIKNWTGKTAVTQLNELCQRSKWHKPEFITKQVSGGGVRVTVRLSKEDKTRVVRTLVFDAPNVYDNGQEARHMAAVYALHRVNSHMPMHRVLPPDARDYWLELEKQPKVDTDDFRWPRGGSDPFDQPHFVPDDVRAQRERQEAAAVRQQERQAEQRQREAEGEPPQVRLSSELRESLELLLRSMQGELKAASTAGAGKGSKHKPAAGTKAGAPPSATTESDMEALVRMGFVRAHAAEALSHAGSRDDAIGWLCVHVPEQDLPPGLAPPADLRAEKHDPASLAREYTARRILEYGFPRSAVTDALARASDDEESALALLVDSLSGAPAASVPGDDDEAAAMRTDELTALEAIAGPAFSSPAPHVACLEVAVDRLGTFVLEVRTGARPTYPFEPPVVLIRHPTLPAYARLALTAAANTAARDYVSAPAVYSLSQWLESSAHGVLDALPPLTELRRWLERISLGGPRENSKEERGAAADSWEALAEDDDAPAKAPAVAGSAGRAASAPHLSRAPREHHRRGELSSDRVAAESARLKRALDEWRTEARHAAMRTQRAGLPSSSFASEIVRAVRGSQVVVVAGETGCGKTTQVPQFLLDDAIDRSEGGACNIVCTQPRRIAALSVAARVADERAEAVGRTVGYAIRLETKQSAETRLLFCTTGVLLRRMVGDAALASAGVTHVIVDEVHERSVDGDLLLAALRAVVRSGAAPHLRIVLMSATADTRRLAAYFGGAPIIEIPGRTFPVGTYHIAETLDMVGYYDLPMSGRRRDGKGGDGDDTSGNGGDAGGPPDRGPAASERASRALSFCSPEDAAKDYGLVAAIVAHIARCEWPGAVLVFLPGMEEIRRCSDVLRVRLPELVPGERFQVLPLHSSLQPSEQQRVFVRPPAGTRKVIVATNIAETSVTIDDVAHVIDSGRAREMGYDAASDASCLVEGWVSRAAARQRSGRAGRTGPGRCYRLYSAARFEGMDAHAAPEILRVSLSQLCLQALAMGHGDPAAFLADALDPPAVEAVETAMRTLRDLGAVEARGEGQAHELTALGRHMAAIPAEPRVAKLLVYGAVFGCLSPALTIAACIGARSPFVQPADRRAEADAARMAFSDSARSDLIGCARAYAAWREARQGGSSRERAFCEDRFLSMQALYNIRDLRRQYRDALAQIGFVKRPHGRRERAGRPGDGGGSNAEKGEADDHYGDLAADGFDERSDNERLLSALIAASLYPSVARVVMPSRTYHQIDAGSIAVAPSPQELRFVTRDGAQVRVHPSSVNSAHARFEDAPFLAFAARVRTAKDYVRDTTAASAHALLLFCGDVSVAHEAGIITVDGWIRLSAPARIAVLVNGLRRLLDGLLARKMEDPRTRLAGNAVVDALVRIVTTDGQ